ncbi:interferon-induced very large GTPase 1 [Genypterus blacodes]|uniref:interferon-induced very large GTPase 1 n=1 Tax=Genypterus blacodes TaxID=154954 RepID=UPI003F774042
MSLKLSKRLSSKKKKPPKVLNAQEEVLLKLGLGACRMTPLDPVSMLNISTWSLAIQPPLVPEDLPRTFLQQLWVLCPDARTQCCKTPPGVQGGANTADEDGLQSESQCIINPLDLVTAVYMSANTFLQQEVTMRMFQCQFAVPLVLPHVDPELPGCFLLWPLRGVVSQWMSQFSDQNRGVIQGDLATTEIPLVSCVKFGHCSISKSLALNSVIGSEAFLHRGMDGGHLPLRLSNGLVELAWYLPAGDPDRDPLPIPAAIANLRGDAGLHEKTLHFLCQASSVVVVFCGNLMEKDKCLLAACKRMARKTILIDISDSEKNDERVMEFAEQNLEKDMGLPDGSVLSGGADSEVELADVLRDALKVLLPNELKHVTLEAAAKTAVALGLNVDEGAVCKKAKATVEDVLKGLEEGSAQFREKQLPLQGSSWEKLAELDKKESTLTKQNKKDLHLQQEKKDIFAELSKYKMTEAMKAFTGALFTADKTERTYFLSWMKLRLQALQCKQINSSEDPFANSKKDVDQKDDLYNNRSFYTVSPLTEDKIEEQPQSWSDLTGLEPSEQQSAITQDMTDILHSITAQSTAQQKEQLQAMELDIEPGIYHQRMDDPIMEQQLDLMSTQKEVGVLDLEDFLEEQMPDSIFKQLDFKTTQREVGSLATTRNEDFLEEEIPDPISETPNFNLESGKNGISEKQHASGSVGKLLSKTNTSVLGLEHFLREMGLIFELTCNKQGTGNSNVLRLPSLAADLLLYGIPLELMDGDASNIPTKWLCCVLAEFKRRFPQEEFRTRVMTNLGVHRARNSEVLSALFGVKFPEGRSTRGVYMLVLCLSRELRIDLACNFLLLIDVEGLCSTQLDTKGTNLICANEMATVATGLSDVLIQNLASYEATEAETDFTVIVNALLRSKESGPMPICQLLTQDEGLNSTLQALQLGRVNEILQTGTGDGGTHVNYLHANNPSRIPCVKGPWHNVSLSQPVDPDYGTVVLKLKQNLFEALRKCSTKSAASDLTEFMLRLYAVWEAVKTESFSIDLQSTDIASAFSMLCMKLSEWENNFLEHMRSWIDRATSQIISTKPQSLNAVIKEYFLNELKDEGREEVKTEMIKLRSNAEAYLMKDELHKTHTHMWKPMLMSSMDDLQKQMTEETMQRLQSANESQYLSIQMKNLQTLLEKEEESKLQTLLEKSKSDNLIFSEEELEKEFESVWSNTLSDFHFRPSEKDDITPRVAKILRENLIDRRLQKHMRKVDVMGHLQICGFCIYDEYFRYISRMKPIKDKRHQKLEAHSVVNKVIEDYQQFVADKSVLLADFSDSYITELLENIEKALKEKSFPDIRTAFEVDLKVYLCSFACQDFQKMHDLYVKDRELLTFISAIKNRSDFIYQYRKRDQCQRVAHAFTSMVFRPTALDYIYQPLGSHVAEEIMKQGNGHHLSLRIFHQSLLEELLKEDNFESYLEYLVSYDGFLMRKIQDIVVTHLSNSATLDEWMQQRLGEIVGKMAAAVSQSAPGVNGGLCDTKLLLERVCLIVEQDGDVDVSRDSLEGPLFSISTEWDRFVSCLLEALAAMRLNLVHELFQKEDIAQFLRSHPAIKPQECLYKRVRGCEKQCPLCRAPCEVEDMGHMVHRAVLHRPKGMLSYTCDDSGFLSHISCPESLIRGNMFLNKDTQGESVACEDFSSLYPDWSIDPDSQRARAYWRYVLVRFNGRFAEEYEQEPAQIPEEWREITQEEALDSLKEVFLTTL